MKRRIATVVSLVYLSSNVCFAHKPQENLWKERTPQRPYQIASLPTGVQPFQTTTQPSKNPLEALPQIQSTLPSLFSSKQLDGAQETSLMPLAALAHLSIKRMPARGHGPTVVLIEDIHKNLEAQTHISEAIQAFGDQTGEGKITVGLEGASGPFVYDLYKQLPDRDIASEVANTFFKQGEISGPAHAGFTSYQKKGTHGLDFEGIDDPSLYSENVEAYRAASKLKPTVKAQIASRQKELAEQKLSTFGSQLSGFDRVVEGYRKGIVPFGTYVEKLSRYSNDHPLSVALFLEAYRMEKKLDFGQVETERRQVLEKLVARLKEADTRRLVELSYGYQQGIVSFKDYYQALRDLCRKNGVDLSATRHFDDYIRYVLLSDGISADKLFSDVKNLEARIFDTLAITPAQKQIVKQSRELYLVSQLTDFAMTTEEWGEYKSMTHEACSMLHASCENFSSFEKFYIAAEKRNVAMTTNFLGTRHQALGTSVLVAGGFHTAGLVSLLEQKGFSVVVASPKVTKIEDGAGNQYLSVFDREKTPLEQIFSGQKLFVVERVVGQPGFCIQSDGTNSQPDFVTPEIVSDVIGTAAGERMTGQTVQLARALYHAYDAKNVEILSSPRDGVVGQFETDTDQVGVYVGEPSLKTQLLSAAVSQRRTFGSNSVQLRADRSRKFLLPLSILYMGFLAFELYGFLYPGRSANYVQAGTPTILMTGMGIVAWIVDKLQNSQGTNTDPLQQVWPLTKKKFVMRYIDLFRNALRNGVRIPARFEIQEITGQKKENPRKVDRRDSIETGRRIAAEVRSQLEGISHLPVDGAVFDVKNVELLGVNSMVVHIGRQREGHLYERDIIQVLVIYLVPANRWVVYGESQDPKVEETAVQTVSRAVQSRLLEASFAGTNRSRTFDAEPAISLPIDLDHEKWTGSFDDFKLTDAKIKTEFQVSVYGSKDRDPVSRTAARLTIEYVDEKNPAQLRALLSLTQGHDGKYGIHVSAAHDPDAATLFYLSHKYFIKRGAPANVQDLINLRIAELKNQIVENHLGVLDKYQAGYRYQISEIQKSAPEIEAIRLIISRLEAIQSAMGQRPIGCREFVSLFLNPTDKSYDKLFERFIDAPEEFLFAAIKALPENDSVKSAKDEKSGGSVGTKVPLFMPYSIAGGLLTPFLNKVAAWMLVALAVYAVILLVKILLASRVEALRAKVDFAEKSLKEHIEGRKSSSDLVNFLMTNGPSAQTVLPMLKAEHAAEASRFVEQNIRYQPSPQIRRMNWAVSIRYWDLLGNPIWRLISMPFFKLWWVLLGGRTCAGVVFVGEEGSTVAGDVDKVRGFLGHGDLTIVQMNDDAELEKELQAMISTRSNSRLTTPQQLNLQANQIYDLELVLRAVANSDSTRQLQSIQFIVESGFTLGRLYAYSRNPGLLMQMNPKLRSILVMILTEIEQAGLMAFGKNDIKTFFNIQHELVDVGA